MKPPLFLPATAACLLMGWFLPSLWLARAPQQAAHRIPVALPPAPASQSFTERLRNAGSAMARLQAVVAGAADHVPALVASAKARTLSGFPCRETEELALQIAGEELAKHVTDGVAFLRSIKDSAWEVRCGALAAWAAKDPDNALRAILSNGELTFPNDESLITRLVEKNPGNALKLLQAAGSAAPQTGWASALRILAKQDSSLAAKALETTPSSMRQSCVESVVRALADKDPRAALAWTETLNPEVRKFVSLSAVFEQWAAVDPAAAVTAWKASGDTLNEEVIASHWSRLDPAAALRWVAEDQNNDRTEILTSAMTALARKNPEQALATLNTLSAPQREEAIGSLASGWAGSDFPAALAWARALSDSADQKSALTSLCSMAGELPPAERRAFITEIGEHTAEGFNLLWSLDRKEALGAFAALPPEEQAKAWTSMSADLEGAFPQAVAQLTVPAGKEGEIIPKVAAAWARHDPAGAAAWVGGLPPGEAQSMAAQNLVSVWDRNDPAATASWVRSLPDGAARDASFRQLATITSSGGDQAAAMDFGAAIQNEMSRHAALKDVYSGWMNKDPAAARAAFEALPLEAAEKEKIIKEGLTR